MRLALGVILTAISCVASAQGYVVSSDGQAVRDSQGVCVKTGTWEPGNTLSECEPPKPKVIPISSVPTPIVKPATVVTSVPAPSLPATEVKKIVVQADVLFAFDDAVLSNTGKEELNKLSAEIKSGSKVLVVGHSDAIGDAAYNKKLSQRRANAVAGYLAAKMGAGNFETSGVGSTQPTKETSKCKAIRNWKEKVSCYAPDRRVEVEFK